MLAAALEVQHALLPRASAAAREGSHLALAGQASSRRAHQRSLDTRLAPEPVSHPQEVHSDLPLEPPDDGGPSDTWPARLPRRHHNHQTDQVGLARAQTAVLEDLQWLFRDQPVLDYGIDAHIEVVALAGDDGPEGRDEQSDRVTGQLIGMQAKSGTSWFEEPTGDGWIFRETHRRHLNYWLGHTLPVIVTLYHPERQTVYWERIDEHTVTLTEQGFTVRVPERQRLDASSRPALEDIARRRGQQAVAAFDRSLRQVPPTARAPLRRAAEQDRPGAARLAQTLADGRGQPRLIASQLLAAVPVWLAGSPVREQLWNALGGFCIDHQQHDLAAQAFLRAAAEAAEPPSSARMRAFAGLALLGAEDRDRDRDRAAQELTAARDSGAVLLADVGLTQIGAAPDDARLLPVPDSLQRATDAELDREPTVLNFLAEMRLRAADLTGALALMERAATAGGPDSPLRLRLAELLRRRVQTTGITTGSQDIARARDLAEQVLHDMRRWAGPSVQPLRELLDLDTLVGVLRAVITRSTPSAAGGTATDTEAANPYIAYRGAHAAVLLRDARAAERFVVALGDDPRAQHVVALKLDLTDPDPRERIQAWQRALDAATDDGEKAVIVARLAALGQWPQPVAEELLGRSVVPPWVYQLWQLKAVAAGESPGEALPQLRLLAREQVPAAVELVDLVERLHGPQAAWIEWRRPVDRWRDVLLLEMLPSLTGALHRMAQLDPHVDEIVGRLQDAVGDAVLPVGTRLRLRHQLVRLLGQQQAWDRVVRVSETGLAEQPDEELAWTLITGLYNLRRNGAARAVLLKHRPTPRSEQEVRVWAQLHVATDLDMDTLRELIALVDQNGAASELGGQLAGLAVRELARLEAAGDLPEDLRLWRQQLLGGSGNQQPYGWRAVTEDELTTELAGRDEVPMEALRDEVRAGRVPLADLAAAAGRPYGQALLQRAAGLLVAADLEPGLQQAGRDAARAALAAGAALMDLSALHLLVLLQEDGVRLQALLPDLQVFSGTAADAANTRDAIWTATGPVFTVSLQGGELHRKDLSPTERALLRQRAANLEDVLAHIPLVQGSSGASSATPAGSAALLQQQMDVAARLGVPLYADDVAVRQQARARGLRSFGTSDLLLEAGPRAQVNVDNALLQLAREGVVDLPLSQDQLVLLGAEHRWQEGPALLLLSRPAWWRHHAQDWPPPWRKVSVAAARTSPQSLIITTTAALTGALAACSPSRVTQWYQQLLVQTLDAVEQAGLSAPHDYLRHVAENAAPGVAPSPRYVHGALVEMLQHRAVPDAPSVADRLLPGGAW